MFVTQEKGFEILVKISNLLDSYKIMFALSTFLTLYFVFITLKKCETPKIYIGYLIYIFLIFPTSLTLVRQGIAISITFFSFEYLIKRKLFRYSIVIGIASLFHKTAIILFPFYFFYNFFIIYKSKKKIKKIIKYFILVSLVLIIKKSQYFLEQLSMIPGYERYGIYLNINADANNREFYIKLMVFLFILFIIKIKKINIEKNNKIKICIYFFLFDIMCCYLGFYNPFLKRISLYFEIYQIILIPMILDNLSKNKSYVYEIFITFYVIILFILKFYILNHGNIIPYGI